MPWTEVGLENMLQKRFQGEALETNLYVALFTAAAPITIETELFSSLTEIAIGNGYDSSGGEALSLNNTDFDVLTIDEAGNRAYVQLRDIVFTAAGGPLPADSVGARWMGLTDDNVTVGSRQIQAGWELGADRVVSDGQDLTIQNAELRLTAV